MGIKEKYKKEMNKLPKQLMRLLGSRKMLVFQAHDKNEITVTHVIGGLYDAAGMTEGFIMDTGEVVIFKEKYHRVFPKDTPAPAKPCPDEGRPGAGDCSVCTNLDCRARKFPEVKHEA